MSDAAHDERVYWDTHAELVDVVGTTDPATAAELTDAALAMLEQRLPATGVLLDVGCGFGRLAVPLAARGFAVIGVDVSPVMIDKARAAAADRGVGDRCAFVDGDGRGFPDDLPNVDAAYSVLLFQHVAPFVVAGYLAAVADVLAPGGRFVVQYVSSPHPEGPLSYTHDLTSGTVTSAGFGLVESGPDPRFAEWTWATLERTVR